MGRDGCCFQFYYADIFHCLLAAVNWDTADTNKGCGLRPLQLRIF